MKDKKEGLLMYYIVRDGLNKSAIGPYETEQDARLKAELFSKDLRVVCYIVRVIAVATPKPVEIEWTECK